MRAYPLFPLAIYDEDLPAHRHVPTGKSARPRGTEGDDSSAIWECVMKLLLHSGDSILWGACVCHPSMLIWAASIRWATSAAVSPVRSCRDPLTFSVDILILQTGVSMGQL